jgi:hypothetical protein
MMGGGEQGERERARWTAFLFKYVIHEDVVELNDVESDDEMDES